MANASADKRAADVVDTLKVARLVKQTYGHSSLTSMAKDTIAQFPVLMSADIPLDDAVIIAKAIESYYASLLVATISVHGEYQRDKYDSPVDYLKSFHNNSNIPNLFLSIDSMIEGDSFFDCGLEGATTLPELEKLVAPEVVMECWNDPNSMFNTDSLNDGYQPATYTQSVMESVVNELRKVDRPAMEAVMDDITSAIGAKSKPVDKDEVGTGRREKVQRRDASGKVVTEYKTFQAQTGKQEVVRNDKLTTLEPTLINLQLISHHAGEASITHNVVMGVKAKVQQIPQQFMVSNLASGVQNTRAGIFNWVRWTEGDYKIGRDLILGIDQAKAEAVADVGMRNWLLALKRRKLRDKLSRLLTGQPLPPMTTIVCTNFEAAQIEQMTGIDIFEPYSALKLISEYYLLGFMIYDSETGRLHSIFDSDRSYAVTTLSSLKTKQNKDQDLTQFASFVRAMGRM